MEYITLSLSSNFGAGFEVGFESSLRWKRVSPKYMTIKSWSQKQTYRAWRVVELSPEIMCILDHRCIHTEQRISRMTLKQIDEQVSPCVYTSWRTGKCASTSEYASSRNLRCTQLLNSAQRLTVRDIFVFYRRDIWVRSDFGWNWIPPSLKIS